MMPIRAAGRRAMRGGRIVAWMLLAAAPAPLPGQRLTDYTPNTRAAWTLGKWQPAMLLSHRFELVEGGDELLSIPTVTVATALGARLALGFDYTSNSEVTVEGLGGNETQWWAAFRGPTGSRGAVSGLLAYNTAARSVDGAITARASAGLVSLVGEARAFSDAFGTGDTGFAAAAGGVIHLTEYLSLAGDVGRSFTPDTLGTVWTGGFVFAFPGTRHHFSFHATNGGATTLQGTSRRKAYGPEPVRYGFAFVAPLGTASQWSRIFRRRAAEPEPAAVRSEGGTVRVNIKDLAFSPGTLRIKAGQTVEWVNADPLAHTVTADDKSWGSGFLNQGGTFTRRFTAVGTFPYHCEPHPQMRGSIIVED